MPYHWIVLRSSPPRERRDEVSDLCRKHGGRLCENQIYYDEGGKTFALVELPRDEGKYRALLDELEASEWLGLVHADEKHAGSKPPRSGRRT